MFGFISPKKVQKKLLEKEDTKNSKTESSSYARHLSLGLGRLFCNSDKDSISGGRASNCYLV